MHLKPMFMGLGLLCALTSLTWLPNPPTIKGNPSSIQAIYIRRPVSNDPLGFSIKANKTQVQVGEAVQLTITVRHLNLPSSLLFTFEQANTYRVKVLLPEGFIVTGGTYHDLVGGTLVPGQAPAVYTIEGYFTQVTQQTQFRLLRNGGQATEHSLFVEKSRLTLNVLPVQDVHARLATDCDGASLTASASPTSVNSGGTSTLTATCQGCASGGTLYTTNFDGEQPNSSFQTDYTDQVRVLTNAQNGTDTQYCPVTDHSGNGGSLLRFTGENPGRIWEKTLPVTAGTTYSFSVWVRALYNGSPANGLSQRSLQLQVNGSTIASPSVTVANPGCSSGWAQISGSWTASSTGNVAFALRMPDNTSWQNALAADDITISGGSVTGTVAYSWQALQGGSLASPNSPTTQVTPPSTPGNYTYRVTATSGSCTKTQDVTVTVTQCQAPSLSITSTTCNGSTYSVTFSASANATIQTSAGTIQGNQVTNIPAGSSVTITASLNGCSRTETANTPCTNGIWQIDGDEYILNEY